MRLYREGNPSVSVILPTYNRMKYLSRAIDSVIRQIFTSWELIIVDDGSTDETFSLVNGYLISEPRIRYLKHSNRKLPFTLNTGLLAACGDFVAFIGSDDAWKPEHLSLRMEIFSSQNEPDLVHGGVEIIGDPYVSDKRDRAKKIHLKDCVIGGTFIGKRELFLKLDGFKNIDYSEDSEFFERAVKTAAVKKVDFKTYIYFRDTPGSITNKN